VTNFIYVRRRTQLPLFKALRADVAMTALLAITLPLSILAVGAVSLVIPHLQMFGALTPIGSILVLLVFGLISASGQSALLRRFWQPVAVPGFSLLIVINVFCLALAFTWIAIHIKPDVA
jgi:hypothetical protein